MKKLLLTGFGPFLNNAVNPTLELAKRLDGKTIGLYKVIGRELPVSFEKAPLELSKRMLETKPDAVLSLGLAADRAHITPELVAINYFHSEEPDNDGKVVVDTKLCPDGPPAYFCSFPARKIAQAIASKGIPSKISTSAGSYVCNQVMYELGRRLEGERRIPWGFIHLPPNIAMDELTVAVETAVEML